MDSSATSPDADTSIYSSPEFSVEHSKEAKMKTSVSVSSLAEKFEKSTSTDSTKSEDKSVTDQDVCENQTNKNQDADGMESDTAKPNGIAQQSSAEINVVSRKENHISEGTSHTLDAKNLTDQAAGTENTNGHATNNENSIVDVNTIDPCVSKPSADVNGDKPLQNLPQDSSESSSEQQICKAVEERVAFFAEKISKPLQMPHKADTSANEESRNFFYSQVAREISLQDLAQSFVNALNIVNASEAEKSADTLPVPSIRITEASDREDSSSEESEDLKSKDKPNETEVKTPIDMEIASPTDSNVKSKDKANETEVKTPIDMKMEMSSPTDTNFVKSKDKATNETEVKTPIENKIEISSPTDSNDVEPTPSTSTASECVNKDDSISAEERKAIFYISSSDFPANRVNELVENSDKLRHRPVNQQERTEIVPTLRESQTRSPYCLCSKYTHGFIFVFSFVVAIMGFVLYSLAQDGKAPDFCGHLGLVTAIIAGILGAFSCFCFTCLEAFPRMQFTGYERIRDAENIPPENVKRNVDVEALDNESWSSEKERAFRRQNGMSSTRTSTSSIRRIPTNHRQLIEKADKLKKEVVVLLDSFSEALTNLEPTGRISEMESGMVNGPI